MPLSYLIEERQLFFIKLQRTDNIVLQTVMCVPMVKYEMLGLAAKYGLSDVRDYCLLLGILCGHVLYREWSFSVFSFISD